MLINNKKIHLKKSFSYQKKQLTKNWIFLTLIFIIALVSIFLVMSIGDRGLEIEFWSLINRHVFWKIIIAGGCLGISGYLIQHLSHNKMADTSILGVGNVNSIVLVVMMLLLNLASQESVDNYNLLLPYMFTIFSILSALIVYFLSFKKNKQINKRFLLIGILVNFFFVGISTALSTYLPPGKSSIVSGFIEGKLNDLYDENLPYCGLLMGFLLIWFLFLSRKFKIVSINSDIATELGINTNRLTFQSLIIVGGLCGVSYILVGNITFLGLVAGNISTMIFRKKINFGICSSWLFSITILAISFFIFNNLLHSYFKSPINPALVISLICMPYFIYLLFRN